MKSGICVFLTAVIICTMLACSPQNAEPTLASVTSAEYSDISDSLTISGTTQAKLKNLVFPSANAKVSQICVQTGQKVVAGEAMFYYDDGSCAVAPISGTVLEIYCNEGDISTTVVPCAVVADLTQMQVRAQIGEADLQKIAVGDTADIMFQAKPQRSIFAIVESIAPYAKSASILDPKAEVKTDVVLNIKDKGFEIGPGYSATVKLKLSHQSNACLVPYDFIGQDAEGREFVMVAGKNEFAQKKYIITGLELENKVEVIAGVEASDLIIQKPESVTAGQVIKITVTP